MAETELPETDNALTPAESLALIHTTARETREAVGFSEWPFYLIWGLAWTVAFSVTHLAKASASAPLADLPSGVVTLTWLVCIVGAVGATAVVIARGSRGVTGTTARIGKRIGLSYSAAFAGAGPISALLGLESHQIGAFFVFVVALLYVGQGAVFLDDLQLGVGIWLLAVDVLALALGAAWLNLVLAGLGGGAFLVAAMLSYRSARRVGLEDGRF